MFHVFYVLLRAKLLELGPPRRDDDDDDDDAADAGLSVAIVLIIAFTIGLAVLCVGLIFIRR